jgi:hypothetical protein
VFDFDFESLILYLIFQMTNLKSFL